MSKSDKTSATTAIAAEARGPCEVAALPAAMSLRELRRVRGLSQRILADLMSVKQPVVAKQEHQADMHISTLRRHIEAMGGSLEIVARFPEGDVRISNFKISCDRVVEP